MQGSTDDTHPQGRSQDGCKELCNVQLSIVEREAKNMVTEQSWCLIQKCNF